MRNPDKGRQLLSDVPHAEILPVHLDDPEAVARALAGAGTVFLAMGSVGMEAILQRTAIQAAASVPGFQQLVRLAVLNTGPDSVGINQRGHWSIDFAAQAAGLPYATIRPSIFTSSMLAGAAEIKATRTWTGLADTGRVALIHPGDTVDVVVAILGDPSTGDSTTSSPGPGRLAGPRPSRCFPTS